MPNNISPTNLDFLNAVKKIAATVSVRKCYIAGKIGDLPEAEYKANFEKAKVAVARLGYEPVSPVDLPHQHGRSWSDYMREDLIAMLKCECVYAMHNWR